MRYLFLIIFIFVGCAKKEENIYLDEPTPIQKSTPIYSNYKLKPYKVLGQWYYPRYAEVGEIFRGIASWYGQNFHGKLTASGEIYNMYAYTAANKILPLHTKVKVTNLNNNKSVIVRINDRGPFVKDRIIDLSYVAGKKIGLDKTGIAPVEIVVLSNPKPKKHYKKISKNGKIKIQIGAFKNIDGAKIFKEEYSGLGKKSFIEKIDGKYKVFIGNFKNRQEAIKFKQKNNIKGFVID